MANLKEVRTRIASVSSTQQITSAMKMVSAAKFRKAQNAITGMRPYATMMSEIVSDIHVDSDILSPYHQVRPSNKVLLVVITSNKGLCGAFNANVIKEATSRLDFYKKKGCQQVQMITLGKRATEMFQKQDGLVIESHDDLLDNAAFDPICNLAENIMQRYCNKEFDLVELIYNEFKNSLTQILRTVQFLPIAAQKEGASDHFCHNDYIFEPNKEDILQALIPQMLRTQFYSAILDSLAAEHGARMTAMQNATDNATELLSELRLSYNKARQAAITNEIIEIVSGSEALKN